MHIKEQGFEYKDEKGLFTFYKQQDGQSSFKSKEHPHKLKEEKVDQTIFFSNGDRRLPSFTEKLYYSKQDSNNYYVALTPHSVVIDKTLCIANQIELKQPKTKRRKVPNLQLSQSRKKTDGAGIKRIVNLNFQLSTDRKESHKVNHIALRGRTTTEASQALPEPKQYFKAHSKRQDRIYSRLENVLGYHDEYFSNKMRQASPKEISTASKPKKNALFKLQSSKKLVNFGDLASQPSRLFNDQLIIQRLNHKQQQNRGQPQEIKGPFIQQTRSEVASMNFFNYFQQRKNFFANRYKKQKANKKQIEINTFNYPERDIKPLKKDAKIEMKRKAKMRDY